MTILQFQRDTITKSVADQIGVKPQDFTNDGIYSSKEKLKETASKIKRLLFILDHINKDESLIGELSSISSLALSFYIPGRYFTDIEKTGNKENSMPELSQTLTVGEVRKEIIDNITKNLLQAVYVHGYIKYVEEKTKKQLSTKETSQLAQQVIELITPIPTEKLKPKQFNQFCWHKLNNIKLDPSQKVKKKTGKKKTSTKASNEAKLKELLDWDVDLIDKYLQDFKDHKTQFSTKSYYSLPGALVKKAGHTLLTKNNYTEQQLHNQLKIHLKYINDNANKISNNLHTANISQDLLYPEYHEILIQLLDIIETKLITPEELKKLIKVSNHDTLSFFLSNIKNNKVRDLLKLPDAKIDCKMIFNIIMPEDLLKAYIQANYKYLFSPSAQNLEELNKLSTKIELINKNYSPKFQLYEESKLLSFTSLYAKHTFNLMKSVTFIKKYKLLEFSDSDNKIIQQLIADSISNSTSSIIDSAILRSNLRHGELLFTDEKINELRKTLSKSMSKKFSSYIRIMNYYCIILIFHAIILLSTKIKNGYTNIFKGIYGNAYPLAIYSSNFQYLCILLLTIIATNKMINKSFHSDEQQLSYFPNIANKTLAISDISREYKQERTYNADHKALKTKYINNFIYTFALSMIPVFLINFTIKSYFELSLVINFHKIYKQPTVQDTENLVKKLQEISLSPKIKFTLIASVLLFSYLVANSVVQENQDKEHSHGKLRKIADMAFPHKTFYTMIYGNQDNLSFVEKLELSRSQQPAEPQIVN